MGFKEDAQFARYLTIGVQGTRAVVDDLKRRGHDLVELERYAVGNKVWEVRPKRLRLPDLLCLRCGLRIESKGKSKLEIKLSHGKPGGGREWWEGGMRPQDVFAFVQVTGGGVAGEPASTGRPVYVTRQALQDALGAVKAGTRKAIADGAEADIAWPAWVPSFDGVVVDLDEQDCVVVERPDGRRRVYKNCIAWPAVHLHRQVGDSFEGEQDVVASAVAPASVDCDGEVWAWWDDLQSPDADDRYAAVKACRYHGANQVEAKLIELAVRDEDWRVRLEAIAALATTNSDEPWTDHLVEVAEDVTVALDRQMEAVFILSELGTEAARDGLLGVAAASTGRHEEVRAAAVWGLGLGEQRWPAYAGLFLADASDRVALHAAAAMPEVLPPELDAFVRGWLRAGSPREAALAATLFARRGDLEPLLAAADDASAAGHLFAINALGRLPRDQVETRIGEAVSKELRESLEALWVQREDWLQTPENSGALDVLEAQRLRLLGRL